MPHVLAGNVFYCCICLLVCWSFILFICINIPVKNFMQCIILFASLSLFVFLVFFVIVFMSVKMCLY